MVSEIGKAINFIVTTLKRPTMNVFRFFYMMLYSPHFSPTLMPS